MADDRNRKFGDVDVGLGLRPKNIGARVRRVEDRRLLSGQGTFTDDRIVPAHCMSRSAAAIIRML